MENHASNGLRWFSKSPTRKAHHATSPCCFLHEDFFTIKILGIIFENQPHRTLSKQLSGVVAHCRTALHGLSQPHFRTPSSSVYTWWCFFGEVWCEMMEGRRTSRRVFIPQAAQKRALIRLLLVNFVSQGRSFACSIFLEDLKTSTSYNACRVVFPQSLPCNSNAVVSVLSHTQHSIDFEGATF